MPKPKERRDRLFSQDRCGDFPYGCSSRRSRKASSKATLESKTNLKAWEESRCPVCMEHPHNAILLICTSHEKGCLPFMCDTSYRHSNCFDQYRKSAHFPESAPEAGEDALQPKLTCPLCRGEVKEWIVVDSARRFMNKKARNCACETCLYSGSYEDLRKHARCDHPSARPSDTDPRRERDWKRLEWQRDMGDLLSTLRFSLEDDKDDDQLLPVDDGWLTFYFLIRFCQPVTYPRSTNRARASRSRTRLRFRSFSSGLWGETNEAETASSSKEDDTELPDGPAPAS